MINNSLARLSEGENKKATQFSANGLQFWPKRPRKYERQDTMPIFCGEV